jgi:hypothetical protein
MAVDDKLAAAKADDLYKKPAPDPSYEKQTPPGSIAQGLSKALMQSAFTKFGEAFTDTGDVRKDAATRDSRLAPFQQAGAGAAAALEGRWHTMEYENFQNEFIEPYIAQKKEMLDDYQRRHAQADVGIFEGPDGLPMPVDITTKEGRLMAVRMRGQLEKRFYALNTDMDLELFNEAGKYSNNPMIVGRAQAIEQATSNQLSTIGAPQDTMQSEEAQSVIRGRESAAEAAMVRAKGTAARAKDAKRPISYADAIKDPTIGPGGIMQWLISDPNGVTILTTGGGSAFLDAEKKLAKGALMKSNPSLTEGSAELEDALDRNKPKWMSVAAGKYVKHLSPSDYEMAKQLTPHFFAEEKEKERGVISGDRMAPETRKANVTTWESHAETHFNNYMKDPNNDPSIEAAMEDLEQWIGSAVYGDTDEPELQEVTATRGPGNVRYVNDIKEGVLKHIKEWWASKKGSGIAKEENPDEAAHQRRLSGAAGPRAQRRARMFEARRNRNKGILP